MAQMSRQALAGAGVQKGAQGGMIRNVPAVFAVAFSWSESQGGAVRDRGGLGPSDDRCGSGHVEGDKLRRHGIAICIPRAEDKP